MSSIQTIVFDLGGVLIDWNPRYLYRKIFASEEELDFFLENICTSDWNEEQDAGRSLASAMDSLIKKHPSFEAEIRAYYGRWEEMLGGIKRDTLEILNELLALKKYQIFALTNWSAETFPIAWQRYAFLHQFEGILVSGREGLKKPDPRIYQLLFERFQISASTALFIDDSLKNVKGSLGVGMQAIHFKSADSLRQSLIEYKIPITNK